MAIKVGGTSIISDDKNISNVGIVTIGGSTSGTLEVGNNTGTGVTATGDGTVSIAGTLYAFDVVTPLKIDSFSPDDGATGVLNTTDIRITFDQAIGLSTGFVYIVQNGAVTDTFGVGSTYISRADLNKTLVITPSNPLIKGVLGAANTVTPVVDASFINDPAFTGINTTGSDVTYSFETEYVSLGEAYEGGYFICASGGTQWISAPSSSEVSRNSFALIDSDTSAQQVSGCSGWFVPLCAQLQNPGYVCRIYWDSYNLTRYWSSTVGFSGFPVGSGLDMSNGSVFNGFPGYAHPNRGSVYCVRSFRCVTY